MNNQGNTKKELLVRIHELQLKYNALKTTSELDGNNQVTRLAIYSRDITNRKQALESLSKSESSYRLLAENATDVIWVQDIESKVFNYVSPSAERSLGYSAEEIMNQGLDKILTPSSLNYLNSVIPGRKEHFLCAHHEFYTDKIELVHRNGNTVWLEINSHIIRNKVNGRIEATSAARNITNWKQSEMEREEAVD